MTEQELQEIKGRAAAAYPPPWTARVGEEQTPWGKLPILEVRAGDGDDHRCSSYVCDTGMPEAPGRQAAIAFICAARTDIPALVAEVRRLREDLADATRALASIERCVQVHGDHDRQHGR